jgi:hypothetical protein
MTKFASLRAEIRTITDTAGKLQTANQIFAQVTRRAVTLDNFYVTLGQMVEERQITRFGKKKPFNYKSGPVPVDMNREYRPERSGKIKGFMQLAREREARERGAQ